MQKILIVDDEESIVQLIHYNLTNAGYETITAGDGRLALQKALAEKPDLIVLDVMLPEMDGFDVVRELRKVSRTPVLMLTARSEELDKVLALEMGADDYLSKPFSPREMVARVKAILRRATPEKAQEVEQTIQAGTVVMDEERHQVRVEGAEVQLTSKEYELLHFLISNKGRVFSRKKLLQQLWDYDYFGDTRTIDVHVRHLREKIECDPANPRYLKTVRGVGYKFEA